MASSIFLKSGKWVNKVISAKVEGILRYSKIFKREFEI